MEGEAKVEQYVILASNARGRALCDIVQKATSEPGIFAFGELLDVPNVQQLQGTEFASALDVLKLFAYGTWSDYSAEPQRYKLTDAQQLKLKQLTVVTLAQNSKNIPYAELIKQLEMSNLRTLEDLLITECFYAGIVKGKLDQQQQCLHVQESVGRDVQPEMLLPIMEGLSTWLKNSQGLLGSIEDNIHWAKVASETAEKAQAEADAQVEEAKKNLKNDTDLRSVQEVMMLDDDEVLEERTGPVGRPKRRR